MGALPEHEHEPRGARRPETAPPLSVVPPSRGLTEPAPEPTPAPAQPPQAAPRPAPPPEKPAPSPPVAAPETVSEEGEDTGKAETISASPRRWAGLLLPPDLLHTAPPSIAELLERVHEERALPSTAVRWLYLPHLALACLVTLLAVLLAEAVRNPARFWVYACAIGLLITVGIHLDLD